MMENIKQLTGVEFDGLPKNMAADVSKFNAATSKFAAEPAAIAAAEESLIAGAAACPDVFARIQEVRSLRMAHLQSGVALARIREQLVEKAFLHWQGAAIAAKLNIQQAMASIEARALASGIDPEDLRLGQSKAIRPLKLEADKAFELQTIAQDTGAAAVLVATWTEQLELAIKDALR